MLENPFLAPPQVESPQSRSWGRGFAFGFQAPPASMPTPADVEDGDAFQQGVLAGQEAANGGLAAVTNACVDLNAEGPGGVDFVSSGFEVIGIAKDVAEAAFGAAVSGGLLLLFDLSLGLQTNFDNPGQTLQNIADGLQKQLNDMGLDNSMALYIAGALDFNVAHCELQLTPIFSSADTAVAAAKSLGRRKYVVVRWRTDECGGIDVVDSDGF